MWKFVGVLLVLWVGYDLYAGFTMTWKTVYRAEDPVTYWVALGVWSLLAVSCFFSWDGES